MKTAKIERQNRQRSLFRISAFVTLAILLAVPGCAIWNTGVWTESVNLLDSTDDNSKTGNNSAVTSHHSVSTLTHQSRDTISLAVEFRHIPSSALGETMWQYIDETAFDARVRKAWMANGLRIGLLNSIEDAPEGDAQSDGKMRDPINELFAGAEVLGSQSDGREIIPLRPSRRHELPLAPALEGSHTVLLRQNTGLTGRDLYSPQFLLAVTAETGSRRGQSKLEIRPEIHHGAVRQKFVSSDTAVRIQAGRDRWELAEFDLSWTTHPGATLVIAPVVQPTESEPTFGLGRQMMRDPEHLVDDQHIVAFLQIEN
ncbi:hypothetical protein [Rhodopirellula sp. SWK7]|uniref:hypothetical protein n=1 Tax=Rhodopirellula sp. SWK7 TaxID=595460 RepID=UPI0002BE3FD7|nr:hypothetical protein [Rhodopirellula sp. SWK7]EMI46953.1 putative secreted protein [Rhodopirellula sp. SWK7]